jgi:NADPH2:quinone reductase
MLGNYVYTREEFDHYTSELFQLMARDNMNVQIHEVYPLQDVARAHTVS